MKDWNIDNYGKRDEETRNYTLAKRRQSHHFIPTEGEKLGQYIKRLRNSSLELSSVSQESHINGNKMWYTHRTPAQCWICELDNMSNYSVDLVETILELHPELKDLYFNEKLQLMLTKA